MELCVEWRADQKGNMQIRGGTQGCADIGRMIGAAQR